MRCEEVQHHQALGTHDPEMRAGIQAHLASCEACRSTGLLFAKIDESLKAAPLWVPPRHFSKRVVARAVPARVEPATPHLWGSLAMGIFTVAVVWVVGLRTTTSHQWAVDLSRTLVANSNTLVWTSMALCLAVSAWFTRKALR
jgi:anti-sigma factor RsiW